MSAGGAAINLAMDSPKSWKKEFFRNFLLSRVVLEENIKNSRHHSSIRCAPSAKHLLLFLSQPYRAVMNEKSRAKPLCRNYSQQWANASFFMRCAWAVCRFEKRTGWDMSRHLWHFPSLIHCRSWKCKIMQLSELRIIFILLSRRRVCENLCA